MLTDRQRKLCLVYDPFDGDFGSPGDRTLKDRMGRARKSGPCHLCGGTITPGGEVRMRADVCDGRLMSFRWCEPCCAAMAISWDDQGESLEGRACGGTEGMGT